MGVSRQARATLAVVLVLAVGLPCSAATLSPSFPDSALAMIPIGQSLTVKEVQALGFVPAEAIGAEQSATGVAMLRFERAGAGRVDFIELGAGSQGVQSVGWTKVLKGPEASEVLSGFARLFGFPDDVVAEQGVHAVGWIDKGNSLRLELILQPSEDVGGDPELSALLRRAR